VIVQDARDYLRRSDEKFDVIYLDTYAGENTPWHMLTLEAMQDIKSRLNPGGRVLILTNAYLKKPSPLLWRIESAAKRVFGEAKVFPEHHPDDDADADALINVHVLAGENLAATKIPLPADLDPAQLATLLRNARDASAAVQPTTDDRSDLDYLQAPIAVRWRKLIWENTQADVLGD
jgi:SAM-dependent methyltransferase